MIIKQSTNDHWCSDFLIPGTLVICMITRIKSPIRLVQRYRPILLTCPVVVTSSNDWKTNERVQWWRLMCDMCVTVTVCTDYLEPGVAGPAHKDPTASLSLSTETLSSWMRDANMDADIHFYSRSSLLRRDEYFFRVWYYSRQLFK